MEFPELYEHRRILLQDGGIVSDDAPSIAASSGW
jgi:hypothetical protein